MDNRELYGCDEGIPRKYCPLIKEDCKGSRCALIDLNDMCLVVRGLLSIENIPDILGEIDTRLANIGNYLFVDRV